MVDEPGAGASPPAGTGVAPHRAGLLRTPLAGAAHGPLPLMLTLLTVTTGLVDAVSILALGRVFVANMTGNIVFIGFAAAGAPGFSLQASLLALAAFLLGAGLGGLLTTRCSGHRGRLLLLTTWAELVLLVAAAVVLAATTAPSPAGARDAAVVIGAVALGLQNTAVRALAVPDFTTTVLTMTLTGLAADLRQRKTAAAVRRGISVLAMLLGAVAGAVLVDHRRTALALVCAAALVAVDVVALSVSVRRGAPWHRPAA